MTSIKTPRECADALRALYELEFQGVPRGGFRISRSALKKLTGHPIVHQTLIEDVADWLYSNNLIMIDRDEFFVVDRSTLFDDVRMLDEVSLGGVIS